jgi:hypothetical protein
MSKQVTPKQDKKPGNYPNGKDCPVSKGQVSKNKGKY